MYMEMSPPRGGKGPRLPGWWERKTLLYVYIYLNTYYTQFKLKGLGGPKTTQDIHTIKSASRDTLPASRPSKHEAIVLQIY